MARSRSLRKRLSRLFGWERNSEPASERFRRVFSEAELADPVEALLRWLHGGSVPEIAKDAEARVAALESRYGIRAPNDFRRYLIAAPRFETTDDELTAWWTLDRISSIADEYEHVIANPAIAAEAGAYLFFADYMIWAWAWAVCCSDGPNRGRIAFIGEPDGFVADSFSEFAERYLRDPVEMGNTFPPPTGEVQA